jgi:hypothetical protein
VRPMAKHEVLHHAISVTMEADEFDEDGLRLSDVEYVTDAFPLTAQGQADLVRALREVALICSMITPLTGRDHAKGEFVVPEEHNLSEGDVLLSRGAAKARIRVQATHGFTLADLPHFYRALSVPPGAQAKPDAVAAIQGRSRHDTTLWTTPALELLRSAPVRVSRLSLAHLERTIGHPPALADTAALSGFLTALIAFVRGMHTRAMSGGIKPFLPIMHRNDFATMFGLLPSAQRDLLRANQTHFIDAILAGVFGDPGLGIERLDIAAYVDRPVVKSLALNSDDRKALTGGARLPATVSLRQLGTRILLYRPLPRGLTIERWITAWLSAHDPADLLTAAHFHAAQLAGVGDPPAGALKAIRDVPEFVPFSELIDWTRSYEQGGQVVSLVFAWERLSKTQRAILADSVRGLGALGAATDSEHAELALFENRLFRGQFGHPETKPHVDGGRLTVAAATETIAAYFSGMRELFGTT